MIAYLVSGLALALLVAVLLWRHERAERQHQQGRAAAQQRELMRERERSAMVERERAALARIVADADAKRADIKRTRDALAREAAVAAAGIDRAANATTDPDVARELNAAEGL